MANFQEGSSRISFPSGNDFTNSGATYDAPYTFVKLSSGTVVSVSSATDPAIGILYNCPDANGTADVMSINQQGTVKAACGGSISANALVTFNSSGQLVAATQTSGGDQPTVVVVGRAITAGVSGQVIPIQTFTFLY